MRVKFVYVSTDQTPLQRGHIVSMRTETAIGRDYLAGLGLGYAVAVDSGVYPDAQRFGVTDWLDISDSDLVEAFRGNRLISEAGEFVVGTDSKSQSAYNDYVQMVEDGLASPIIVNGGAV